MPGLLAGLRCASAGMRSFHCQSLAQIIHTQQEHIRPHTPDILTCILSLWADGDIALQVVLCEVVDTLVGCLGGGFFDHVSEVIGPLAFSLGTPSANPKSTQLRMRILTTLAHCGSLLDDYFNLVASSICAICENPDDTQELRIAAAQTLESLALRLTTFAPYATRVITCILRLLDDGPEYLYKVITDVLNTVVSSLGQGALPFLPVIEEVRSPFIAVLLYLICASTSLHRDLHVYQSSSLGWPEHSTRSDSDRLRTA